MVDLEPLRKRADLQRARATLLEELALRGDAAVAERDMGRAGGWARDQLEALASELMLEASTLERIIRGDARG